MRQQGPLVFASGPCASDERDAFLTKEAQYGFFDGGGGSLDYLFKADGQGIELGQSLGNVVAVCLVGNELVEGTTA